jgi:hypothetical protein
MQIDWTLANTAALAGRLASTAAGAGRIRAFPEENGPNVELAISADRLALATVQRLGQHSLDVRQPGVDAIHSELKPV